MEKLDDFTIIKQYSGNNRFEVIFRYEKNGHRLCSLLNIVKIDTKQYYVLSTSDNNSPYDFLKYKGIFEDVADSFE